MKNIKLKDITFSLKTNVVYENKVRPGAEMVALYLLPDGINECVYAMHDYKNTELTELFKKEALYAIRFKVKEFLKKENINWTAWMGINIYSSLPENLIQKSINAISNDEEFIKWWQEEIKRQQKEND